MLIRIIFFVLAYLPNIGFCEKFADALVVAAIERTRQTVSYDGSYFSITYIGIISNQKNSATGNPLVIHNIGSGPEIEDMLFKYKITGHYNFVPEIM